MAKPHGSSAQIIPFPKGAPSGKALEDRINWMRTAEAARNIDQSLARRAYLLGFLDATMRNGASHA